MDIEGAELEALKGAREIIVRDRPKLAISIYHNAEDYVEISAYIKSLVPDYKGIHASVQRKSYRDGIVLRDMTGQGPSHRNSASRSRRAVLLQ